MKILPKKPFTWILLGIIIYTYVEHYQSKRQHTLNDKNAIVAGASKGNAPLQKVDVSPEKKDPGLTDKTVNYFVKELGKTQTGQAVLKALAEQEAQKNTKISWYPLKLRSNIKN